ncbi:MAG: hypothetical protein M0D57_21445 [Sphingobacteriales bacterium JAD_PAG50586_3]|nr:MAG: hypothetical protein M0D57_21445 [Sphingobacteriales bacterium JAD_PAG50586_3]
MSILGQTISLVDIKNNVNQKKSMEFTATKDAVNLSGISLPTIGSFQLPPLGNKEHLYRVLWQASPQSDSEKWDFIIMLTYLNDGVIYYDEIDDNNALVTIKF